MEHHENSSSGEQDDSKEHSPPRSGGGSRRSGSVVRTFCLRWFGIFIVAKQFTTASAEHLCHAFNRVNQNFDLIGLISAFGTAAATKSLSYSALNDGSLYLTGHIGPGSLNVAAALFEATGFRLARSLALGGTGDAYSLVQLDCPNGMHYIGLKSNTICSVGNSVGASIVREHQSLWKDEMRRGVHENGDMQADAQPTLGRHAGRRDSKREVNLIILEVGKAKEEIEAEKTEEEKVGIKGEQKAVRTKEKRPSLQNEEEKPVSLTATKTGTLLLGWLPLLLTFGVIVSCFICKLEFVGELIIFGTLGMTVAVFGLRICHFKYSESEVAEGAPEGDCLVVDDTDASTLHIIKGKEESIQALFQRKIEFQASFGKCLLFLAGSILYVYVIASVLCMPNVSTSGQIHFAIANIIGFVADVLKASQNGKLGLAKKARKQLKVDLKDYIVFKNRTAAIACVAKHANDRTMLKKTELLPCDGPVWSQWWDKLPMWVGVLDDSIFSSVDAASEGNDDLLLRTLLGDMKDGLTEPIRG